jgi:hypothetical protein
MSLKTKGRCGEAEGEAGMSMEIMHLAANSGNVIENKGGY